MLKNLKINDTSTLPVGVSKQYRASNTLLDGLILYTSGSESGSLYGTSPAYDYLNYSSLSGSEFEEFPLAYTKQEADYAEFKIGQSGSGLFFAENEPINKDGSYKRIVFDSINNFYFKNDIINPFSVANELLIFTIPKEKFGDKILKNTFKMTDGRQDNGFSIIDDGVGNLISENLHYSDSQVIEYNE